MADAPMVDPLDGATAALKDSSKWLIAAFGAVAAVVFAGVAVSDISGVTDLSLRALALGSVAIAFVGIGGAIVAASLVLSSGYTTFTEIRDAEVNDLLLAGHGHLSELKADYAEALVDQAAAVNAYISATGAARAQKRVELDNQNTRLTALNSRVAPILAGVRYLRVREAFNRARIAMVAAAALTVIGAFGFVLFTAAAPGAPVVGTTPTSVSIDLTASGETKAREALGDNCVLTDLKGTAIATTGTTVVVAIPGSSTCTAAIIDFAEDDATITAAK